jgi:hypothetical protein
MKRQVYITLTMEEARALRQMASQVAEHEDCMKSEFPTAKERRAAYGAFNRLCESIYVALHAPEPINPPHA